MNRAATLREALENEIAAGILRAGDRLDEVQLATRFNVSRTPSAGGAAPTRLVGPDRAAAPPGRGSGKGCSRPAGRDVRRDGGARRDVRAPCGPPPDGCGPGSASEGAPELREGSDDEGRGPLLLRERTVPPRALPGQPEPVSCRGGGTRLHNRLKPYRRLQLRTRGRIATSIAEHEQVVAAILDGDGSRAEERARAHIVVQGERFADLMASLHVIEDAQT